MAGPARCQGRVAVPTRRPRDGGGPRCHPTGAIAGVASPGRGGGATQGQACGEGSHCWGGIPQHRSATFPEGHGHTATGSGSAPAWDTPSFPSSSPRPTTPSIPGFTCTPDPNGRAGSKPPRAGEANCCSHHVNLYKPARPHSPPIPPPQPLPIRGRAGELMSPALASRAPSLPGPSALGWDHLERFITLSANWR